jgi:hypothetical protein
MARSRSAQASEPTKMAPEEVVREYAPVGKYRVRALKGKSGVALDIREYVSAETFEGFTRRGIRLSDRAQVELLREALVEFLKG